MGKSANGATLLAHGESHVDVPTLVVDCMRIGASVSLVELVVETGLAA